MPSVRVRVGSQVPAETKSDATRVRATVLEQLVVLERPVGYERGAADGSGERLAVRAQLIVLAQLMVLARLRGRHRPVHSFYNNANLVFLASQVFGHARSPLDILKIRHFDGPLFVLTRHRQGRAFGSSQLSFSSLVKRRRSG